MKKIELTPEEVAAIAAALNILWCHAYDGWPEDGIHADASAGGAFKPLTYSQIRALADRVLEA